MSIFWTIEVAKAIREPGKLKVGVRKEQLLMKWVWKVIICVTSTIWTIQVAKAIREPCGLKVGLRKE